jgi:hypothetical protein
LCIWRTRSLRRRPLLQPFPDPLEQDHAGEDGDGQKAAEAQVSDFTRHGPVPLPFESVPVLISPFPAIANLPPPPASRSRSCLRSWLQPLYRCNRASPPLPHPDATLSLGSCSRVLHRRQIHISKIEHIVNKNICEMEYICEKKFPVLWGYLRMATATLTQVHGSSGKKGSAPDCRQTRKASFLRRECTLMVHALLSPSVSPFGATAAATVAKKEAWRRITAIWSARFYFLLRSAQAQTTRPTTACFTS